MDSNKIEEFSKTKTICEAQKEQPYQVIKKKLQYKSFLNLEYVLENLSVTEY